MNSHPGTAVPRAGAIRPSHGSTTHPTPPDVPSATRRSRLR